MDISYCLFCKSHINVDNQIDIRLSSTIHNKINLEEFIKESILPHSMETINGQFICIECCNKLNQFEEYILKSKEIQDCLQRAYRQTLVTVKEECTLANIVEGADETETNTNTAHTRKTREKRNSEPPNIKSDIPQIISNTTKKIFTKRKANVALEELTEDCDTGTVFVAKDSYCCEICGKVTKKANAAKHMNIHTKKQKFVCEFCNKTFTQKIDLKRHINIHMGIFPYVCEFCGKKFTQHTSYNIHKKNHLGLREFKCIICEKAMLSKSHLDRHMRTHTSEKKFDCEICGKSFAEKYNCNSHMKKVHNYVPSNQQEIYSRVKREAKFDKLAI